MLVMLSVLSLAACTPTAKKESQPSTPVQASDCNTQVCLQSALQPLNCNANGERRMTLSVRNVSSSLARYRIDYYKGEVGMEQGSNLAQITIGTGQTHDHNLVSPVFGQNLTITVAQLNEDGSFIVDDNPLTTKLTRC